MTEFWVTKTISKFAIVGHEYQTLALKIKPPYRKKMTRNLNYVPNGLAIITWFMFYGGAVR